MPGDEFGFPASSFHIPPGATFAPIILELSFPGNTSIEDCVVALHRDTSELLAHDSTVGTIISIPLQLQKEPPRRFTSAGNLKDKRILLVNDEESVRKGLCEVLTFAHCDCRAVSGGPEALAILNSEEGFDLLIHDLLNPHLDGLSLLQLTKRRFPELPVIVASAINDRAAAIACLQNGAYAYLRMPLNIEHLLQSISEALAVHGAKEGALKSPTISTKTRKSTSEMSDAELTIALLTNEQTGLPNERAFLEEREQGPLDLPYVAHADIDDFKRLRRELGGSEQVERVMLEGVGRYLREAVKQQESSIRVYHGGGDYFTFRAVNEQAFAELIAHVNQRLSNTFFIITLPDAKIVRRIARKLSKQPQSIHGRINTSDDWKIEDLPPGSRITAMSLDDGTLLA